MEGYDFKRFEGETATLSFWVKAVKTGIYCVSFRNNAVDKSYVSEFTINAASTWEKKSVTLTFNAGGTWLYTTGRGLSIKWAVMCGSTLQTATANKNTWLAGNYEVTDAQVNGLDSTDNDFWLTGVQLELGSVATPFEVRPFAQELALCQRYYEKSFAYATAPAQAVGTSTGEYVFPAIQAGATNQQSPTVSYRVRKRATATVTLYNPVSSNAEVRGGGAADSTGSTVAHASEVGFVIYCTGSAVTAVTHQLFIHWQAVAEL